MLPQAALRVLVHHQQVLPSASLLVAALPDRDHLRSNGRPGQPQAPHGESQQKTLLAS